MADGKPPRSSAAGSNNNDKIPPLQALAYGTEPPTPFLGCDDLPLTTLIRDYQIRCGRGVDDFQDGNLRIQMPATSEDGGLSTATSREELRGYDVENLVHTVVHQAIEKKALADQVNDLCQIIYSLHDEILVLQEARNDTTFAAAQTPTAARTPSRALVPFTFNSPFQQLRAPPAITTPVAPRRQRTLAPSPPPTPGDVTALTTTTHSSGGRSSPKWPDAEKLDDGKNPTFEDWERQINTKLRHNADWFPTPDAQGSYVLTRVTGAAATVVGNLVKQLKKAGIREPSLEQTMEALRREFTDPLRAANARSKLKSMTYEAEADLASFMRTYEQHATDAEYEVATMKEELLDKLPDEWRVALYTQCHDSQLTFPDFKLHVQAYYDSVVTRGDRTPRALAPD